MNKIIGKIVVGSLFFWFAVNVCRPSGAQTVNQSERPELVLQNGHSLRSDGLAFSPDGRYLASASADSTVRIWDAATGNELRTLSGHVNGVRTVAFSPDGRLLGSGGVDGKVKLWDAASGRELASLNSHTGRINTVIFSRDGALLASGSADKTIKLWDVATQREVRTLSGFGGVLSPLAFSADGKTLASGNPDGTIQLWDVSTGQPAQLLRQTDAVTSLAFSPTGNLLASGSLNSAVRLWNLPQTAPAPISNLGTGRIVALSFNADGSQLLAASFERMIRRVDVATRRELQVSFDTERLEKYEALAFSPDGQTLALCPGTRDIEVRKLSAFAEVTKLSSRANPVQAVAFSNDGRWFATGNRDTSSTLWDTNAGRLTANFAGNTGSVNAVAFSADSQTLATGSQSGIVRTHDVIAARETRNWQAHEDGVNALLFTPDGKQLITASSDQSIKVWDAASGNPMTKLVSHAKEVRTIALSPDGKWLASGASDGAIKIWQTGDWREIQTLPGHSGAVFSLAFSDDGKRLASGGADKAIKLWDTTNWQTTRTIDDSNAAIYSLAFSPDNRQLAAGNTEAVIRLLDPSTGAVLKTLTGASGIVNGLSFSDDGRFLTSAHEDGSLRVWDGKAGELAATAVSLRESAEWLVVTPDGLFDGSPAAWPQILWRFARNTFNVTPVEIFFNEFFYPDLLADVLAGKNPRPTRKIAQLDRRQPRVQILVGNETAKPTANTVKSTIAAGQRTVSVKIEVAEAASGSGAQDVRLFRNGALYKIWRGNALKPGGRGTVETTIPIVAGENRLTAYAYNRDNIKSLDETRIVIGPEAIRKRGTAYIVAVGVNRYANPNFNLRFAVPDAKDFSDELLKRQTALNRFASLEVVTLFDDQATKANITNAVKRLAGAPLPAGAPPVLEKLKPTQPEDAVIVFFAGHGIAVESRFYLIPHDLGYTGAIEGFNEEAFRRALTRSISDQELVSLFEGVDAGELLVVIDACNSGQVLESDDLRPGPMNSKGLAQLAYEKGIFVLTASQSYQAAKENAQLGHGYLTYALIESGLRKLEADNRPRDNQVLMREWLDYATAQVPRMQETKYQAKVKEAERILRRSNAAARLKVKPDAQRPRVFYRREAEPQPFVISQSPK